MHTQQVFPGPGLSRQHDPLRTECSGHYKPPLKHVNYELGIIPSAGRNWSALPLLLTEPEYHLTTLSANATSEHT